MEKVNLKMIKAFAGNQPFKNVKELESWITKTFKGKLIQGMNGNNSYYREFEYQPKGGEEMDPFLTFSIGIKGKGSIYCNFPKKGTDRRWYAWDQFDREMLERIIRKAMKEVGDYFSGKEMYLK